MPISTKDLIFNFTIGGILVSCTALIASKYSSKIAALFWSLPITLIPIIIFFYYKKVPQEDITNFVKNTIPSIVLLLFYILVLWLALKNNSFWKSLGISLTVLIIFIIIFLVVVESNGKIRI
jgi:hypothetical protein